MFEPVTSPL